MKVTGIVCEYNPFHRGHAHLLEKIREKDPDTAVVCALSGGFVQRGEPAVFSASDRAEAALVCGADLVLLLPFPWSMGPAEVFARAGTFLLRAVGCDSVAFGTEGDVLPRLQSAAARLSSQEFEEALCRALAEPENAGVGYPALRDRVYASLYGAEDAELLRTPNDLLAAEYLRAAPELVPFAVPRIGDAHDGAYSENSDAASASAVRALLRAGKTETALSLLPPASAEVFSRAIEKGNVVFPDDSPAADALLLWHFRSHGRGELARYAGLSGGLAGRLADAARKTSSLPELFSLAATKKYTDAAVRRAAWYGFFGVTEEELRTLPPFLEVLALNERGARVLHEAKRSCPVPILSRPAAYRQLDASVREQVLRSLRAEIFRGMLCRVPVTEAEFFVTVQPAFGTISPKPSLLGKGDRRSGG